MENIKQETGFSKRIVDFMHELDKKQYYDPRKDQIVVDMIDVEIAMQRYFKEYWDEVEEEYRWPKMI